MAKKGTLGKEHPARTVRTGTTPRIKKENKMQKTTKKTQAALDQAAAHANNGNHAGARRILETAARMATRKADAAALAAALDRLANDDATWSFFTA